MPSPYPNSLDLDTIKNFIVIWSQEINEKNLEVCHLDIQNEFVFNLQNKLVMPSVNLFNISRVILPLKCTRITIQDMEIMHFRHISVFGLTLLNYFHSVDHGLAYEQLIFDHRTRSCPKIIFHFEWNSIFDFLIS